jgi:hypothetical protein
MSDQLRDLVRPVGEFDPPLDLHARISARERVLATERRPARAPRMLVRIAAVAGALLILGALALAAHSRGEKAKPAKSPFPTDIALVKTSHCNIRFGSLVWFFVGLRNTGDVDREVEVLPWRRLSNNVISYPASAPYMVKVPAHATKMFNREARVDTESGTVQPEGCGVILDNDFDHIHPLRITRNSSIP